MARDSSPPRDDILAPVAKSPQQDYLQPWAARYLAVALGLFVLAFASIWVASSYLGIGPSTVVSHYVNDLHCEPARQGLGLHCFSDFSIVREVFSASDPWNAGEASTTYPPLAWAPALILAVANYTLWGNGTVGLWIYLGLAAACALFPAVWASRGRRARDAILTVLVLGLGAAPVLVLLDRGNTLAFAIPLVMLAVVGFFRDDWRLVTVCIIAAAVLKPQLVLLAVLPLSKRRYRAAVVSVGSAVIITVLSFALLWTHFPANLFGWLRSLLGYAGYQDPGVAYPYNFGIGRSVVGLVDLATGGTLDAATRNGLLDVIRAVQTPLTVAVTVGGVLFLWLLGRRIASVYLVALALLLVLYTSSVVYSYYLALFIVLGAVLVRDPLDRTGRSGTGSLDGIPPVRRQIAWPTTVVTAAVMAPIVLPTSAPLFTEGVHARLAGSVVGLYPIMLGPVVLVFFVTLCGGLAWALHRDGQAHGGVPQGGPMTEVSSTDPPPARRQSTHEAREVGQDGA